MDKQDDQDRLKIQALLERTGEFIAYFELAETKMLEWRQQIEQRENALNTKIEAHFLKLESMMAELENVFSQAGVARFRIQSLELLEQGQAHLDAIAMVERKLLLKINAQQRILNELSEKAIEQISAQSHQTLIELDQKLAQLKLAQQENNKQQTSKKTLKSNWHHTFKTVTASLLAAFAVGLYLTDEYPWEVHQQAKNERSAGQILKEAWPKLTQLEKEKIAGNQVAQLSQMHKTELS